VNSSASLQFSSLPGPSATVLVGGHPLKGVYTILPAPSCSGLAISVFTYADQVYVTALSEMSCQNLTKKLLTYLHHEVIINLCYIFVNSPAQIYYFFGQTKKFIFQYCLPFLRAQKALLYFDWEVRFMIFTYFTNGI